MILHLVRHGDALDGSPGGDAARPLSKKGEQDIEALAMVLAGLQRPVGRILTSPLLRAEQTGRILSRVLSNKVNVEPTELLAPGFRYRPLIAALDSGNPGAVIAVCHQPDCTGFLSHLISGRPIEMQMNPGTAASVQISSSDPNSGRLLWLLTPELARQITESPQRSIA